jgi:hypothetical protein
MNKFRPSKFGPSKFGTSTFEPTGFPKQQRGKRYSTELPTCVNGVEGVTRDVSVSGLFIIQDQECEPGSHIDFWVNLDTPGGKLKLCCEGEVIRVEKIDQRFGLGVKILSQVIKELN